MKTIALILTAIVLMTGITACSNATGDKVLQGKAVIEESVTTMKENMSEQEYSEYIKKIYTTKDPMKDDVFAVMETTKGTITMRLFRHAAPKAVENFIGLATSGKYDDVIFHRVMDNFMIQGGDPTGTGYGGESIWGKPFEDEFSSFALNLRGALSMANSGENTNGSQFFIVQNKTIGDDYITAMKDAGYPDYVCDLYKEMGGYPSLDFVHTVFGAVIDGMDVVDSIAAVETDETDKPLSDIKIKSIKITEYK